MLGRRADGFHEIESLVAFADVSDWLGYEPGPSLELAVEGPMAAEAGATDRNLVLRAARALAARIPDLMLGRFRLFKRLPGAAGIGGGSSDAAAALAALAEENGLAAEDERLGPRRPKLEPTFRCACSRKPEWCQELVSGWGLLSPFQAFSLSSRTPVFRRRRDMFSKLLISRPDRVSSPQGSRRSFWRGTRQSPWRRLLLAATI